MLNRLSSLEIMTKNPIDGQRHIDWLERMGLHETAYSVCLYYIEIDAIGPAAYDLDDAYDAYDEWSHGSYDDWQKTHDRQERRIKWLNRRDTRRRKKREII